MLVKRNPDRFKTFYPDKRAIIPRDYDSPCDYYELFCGGKWVKIKKESSNEQESSN